MTKRILDPRTHAQKRRKEARDAIREKFQGIAYSVQLEKIAKEMGTLKDSITKLIKKRVKIKCIDNEDRTSKQKSELMECNELLKYMNLKMDILSKQADLNFRRLKFVLPELKAVEISDPSGNNPFETLAAALSAAVQQDD